MRLLVAGRDRAGDLGSGILAAAETLRQNPLCAHLTEMPPELAAAALLHNGSESEYLAALIRLLRRRDATATRDFDIPTRPGRLGAGLRLLKKLLWKLLRYQHERVAFHQNRINNLITATLEFELAERTKAIERLEQRLKLMEQKAAGPPAAGKS